MRISLPLAGLWLLLALVASQSAWAESAEAEAKGAALKSIPYDKLTPQASQKILSVVEKHSLFRRVPAAVTDCDPDMFQHCLRSPEVVINIWQLMGITTVETKRTGNFTWSGTDGAGTTGTVELIYGSDKLHIYFCDGFYEGALLRRKVTGRALMLVQTAPAQTADHRPVMTSQLDFFLALDNAGADLIAKTLSPIINSTADANYTETVSFVGKISQAAERNGPGIQQLANKLQNVQPEIRQQFSQTAATVNQRAAIRTSATAISTGGQSPKELGLEPEVAANLPGGRAQ